MNDLLSKLTDRLKAKNGLVVNAEVWAKAHEFHFDHHRAHLLTGHGAGILTGLNVELRTDRDNQLWIGAGMAVNQLGQLAILKEDTSFILNLHSLRSQSENVEHLEASTELIYIFVQIKGETEVECFDQNTNHKTACLRTSFMLSTASSLPETAIELARVRLHKSGTPIREPEDSHLPGPNELDRRFRRYVGAKIEQTVGVGICYLGKQTGHFLPRYGRQARHLARAWGHLSRYSVCLDDDIQVTDDLRSYDLIYLIEQGAHVTDMDTERALLNHVKQGGTLLVEAYQIDSPLFALFQNAGFEFASMPEELLVQPFLFSEPPPGFNTKDGRLRVADGIVFSTRDYGRLWQCRPPQPREAIRAATEWGANIITYAVQRRQEQR